MDVLLVLCQGSLQLKTDSALAGGLEQEWATKGVQSCSLKIRLKMHLQQSNKIKFIFHFIWFVDIMNDLE